MYTLLQNLLVSFNFKIYRVVIIKLHAMDGNIFNG